MARTKKKRDRLKAGRKETSYYSTERGRDLLARLCTYYEVKEGRMNPPKRSQILEWGLEALAKQVGLDVQPPAAMHKKDG